MGEQKGGAGKRKGDGQKDADGGGGSGGGGGKAFILLNIGPSPHSVLRAPHSTFLVDRHCKQIITWGSHVG